MVLYSKGCQDKRTERELADAKNEFRMLLIDSTMIFIKEVMQTLSCSKGELWNYNKDDLEEFISLKSRINEISPPTASLQREERLLDTSEFCLIKILLVYPELAVSLECLPYFYLYI